jgi:hypothetical protein
MPPKQIHGKGRTLAEPSFVQTTLQVFTDKENRSVVAAVGMFAVRAPMQQIEKADRKWRGKTIEMLSHRMRMSLMNEG